MLSPEELDKFQDLHLRGCTREAEMWVSKGWEGAKEYLRRCHERDYGVSIARRQDRP